MDVEALRRAAPMFYGAVVVLTLFFARDAFVPVLIGGAVVLGLFIALARPRGQRGGRDGRARQLGRPRRR